MNETVISLDAIGIQAARAAAEELRTGRPAQNPYCPHFEPGHHAEFALRFKVAMERLRTPTESEGAA